MAKKMMALGIVGLVILIAGVNLAVSKIYAPAMLGINDKMVEILFLLLISFGGGGFQFFYLTQAIRQLNIMNFIINAMFIAGIIAIIVGGVLTVVGWTLHAKKE